MFLLILVSFLSLYIIVKFNFGDRYFLTIHACCSGFSVEEPMQCDYESFLFFERFSCFPHSSGLKLTDKVLSFSGYHSKYCTYSFLRNLYVFHSIFYSTLYCGNVFFYFSSFRFYYFQESR